MNTLFAVIAGGLVGAMVARRRDGAVLDYVHHIVVFAIIFAVIGLGLTVFLNRSAG